MPESGRRVVLLARPGPACDRLRTALTEAAVQQVLEADPTQVSLEELAAAQPELVIVVLDSATEAVLQRLDSVLHDPAIDVMYEEADVAANRSGWDAARWVRHLSAKLNRHADVLPPGAASSGSPVHLASAPAPVAVDAPADAASDFAFDVAGFAPIDPTPAHPLADDFSTGVDTGSYGAFDPVAAEIVDFELNADQVITFDASLRDDFLTEALHVPADSGGIQLPSLDPLLAEGLPTLDLVFESELELPVDMTPATSSEPLQFNDFSLDDLHGEPHGLTAPDDVKPDLDFDIAASDSASAHPALSGTETASPFAGLSNGHVLALVTDDTPSLAGPADGLQQRTNLADLERRIASLELVDDQPPVPRAGAVLLVAGIGGPDAVRQVLGALPEGFARPVIVQQRLDGGRYDRLVSQLERATRLPVDLAEPGSTLRPGVVYVLPAGVGLASNGDALAFDDSGRTFESLPPQDSAILLLSGSDAAMVDRLVEPAWSDAFVAGQATDGCYDAVASNALAAHGRPTASPAELAQRLAERWSAA